MENFKINDYNKIEQKNTVEEFDDFHIENFENISESEKQEIERGREREQKDLFEKVNDVYARIESDRNGDNFMLRDDEIRNMQVVHFEDYHANMDTYEGRSDFIYRAPSEKSLEEISKEYQEFMGQKRPFNLKDFRKGWKELSKLSA